jgi:hypothetical protein
MEGFLKALAHEELGDRNRWLIQFRWLSVAGTVAAILVGNAVLPNTLPLVQLFAVTAGLAL